MSSVMTPEGSREAMKSLEATKRKAAAKYQITIDRLMKHLNDELEAHETKVFNDKEEGIVYSVPLIAWKVRQEARRDAEAHLGIKPAEKQEVEYKGTVTYVVKDYSGKVKKQKGNGSGD